MRDIFSLSVFLKQSNIIYYFWWDVNLYSYNLFLLYIRGFFLLLFPFENMTLIFSSLAVMCVCLYTWVSTHILYLFILLEAFAELFGSLGWYVSSISKFSFGHNLFKYFLFPTIVLMSFQGSKSDCLIFFLTYLGCSVSFYPLLFLFLFAIFFNDPSLYCI